MFMILLLVSVSGCGDTSLQYNTEDGKGLFVEIKTDNAGILSTNTDCYHYYYLKDTKTVYVGYISKYGTIANSDCITPVVTGNGNYCIYDTEKKQVVEISGGNAEIIQSDEDASAN